MSTPGAAGKRGDAAYAAAAAARGPRGGTPRATGTPSAAPAASDEAAATTTAASGGAAPGPADATAGCATGMAFAAAAASVALVLLRSLSPIALSGSFASGLAAASLSLIFAFSSLIEAGLRVFFPGDFSSRSFASRAAACAASRVRPDPLLKGANPSTVEDAMFRVFLTLSPASSVSPSRRGV